MADAELIYGYNFVAPLKSFWDGLAVQQKLSIFQGLLKKLKVMLYVGQKTALSKHDVINFLV